MLEGFFKVYKISYVCTCFQFSSVSLDCLWVNKVRYAFKCACKFKHYFCYLCESSWDKIFLYWKKQINNVSEDSWFLCYASIRQENTLLSGSLGKCMYYKTVTNMKQVNLKLKGCLVYFQGNKLHRCCLPIDVRVDGGKGYNQRSESLIAANPPVPSLQPPVPPVTGWGDFPSAETPRYFNKRHIIALYHRNCISGGSWLWSALRCQDCQTPEEKWRVFSERPCAGLEGLCGLSKQLLFCEVCSNDIVWQRFIYNVMVTIGNHIFRCGQGWIAWVQGLCYGKMQSSCQWSPLCNSGLHWEVWLYCMHVQTLRVEHGP